MPLISKLFRGDPVFEACLVKDAAHIVPGSAGPHVSCIQYALIVLDRYRPAKAEIDRAYYGPTTAAGVLAFKRRRRIINASYQSTADNIVGRMTIAALDAEMARAEQAGL